MTHKAKRSAGRPMGRKDSKPRKRLPRIVVAPEIQNLSVREAGAVAGVSASTIKRHLDELGAVRIGARIIVFRSRLNAWLQSLPSAPTMPSAKPRAGREHRAGAS